MKAVRLVNPEESKAPAAEPHPMQRFFGPDSVQAMWAALGRFGADKQAEPDDYIHSNSQMQPDSSTVQTYTTAHDALGASALARISGKVCLWSSVEATTSEISC